MSIDDATSRATAVFTDIFQVAGQDVNPDEPAMIERVRVVMASRPGMLRKLLPLRVDADGVTSGGVYLFDTFENAAAYGDWVAEDFRIDGTLFFDHPFFLEPAWFVWNLIGMEDFGDVRTEQHVMRLERWHTLAGVDPDEVRARHWPQIRRQAQQAGLTSVGLFSCPDEHHPQIGLVTVAARDAPASGDAAADLAPLESQPSLGADVAGELGATKVFDRTSWVLQVWFPLPAEGADYEGASVWPNSPPLPGVATPTSVAAR